MDDTSTPRRRRSVLSVRTRIVAVITLAAALAIVGVGVAVSLVERANILESIEERLQANLASARHIVQTGHPDTGTWAAADDALYYVVQRMSPDDNTGALGIVDGRAVMAPAVALDLDLRDAPGFAAHVAAQVDDRGPVIGTYVEEGVAWRYLGAPVAVAGENPEQVVFAMAYDIEAELAEFDDATRTYILSGAIALVVIALVATIVSTRLLRPLRQMRETAERVSAQSLSERLPIQGHDDVSELAATMNDMLDRLDAALDSQRQLLSDVGHELKTPITIVRGNLEVMDVSDPADVAETRVLAVDELDRMSGLVQDLAATAALHGPAPVTPRQVDAGELVQQIGRKADAIHGASVQLGGIADLVCALDPDRITQAMLQLAQNAATHGGGKISIGSRVIGNALELWVRDHGPGVPEHAKTSVFERFHRGTAPDGSGASARGSGLGLNIVQVIARAHGGSARVEDARGGGALFVISIPAIGATSFTAGSPDGLIIPPKPPLPTSAGTRAKG